MKSRILIKERAKELLSRNKVSYGIAFFAIPFVISLVVSGFLNFAPKEDAWQFAAMLVSFANVVIMIAIGISLANLSLLISKNLAKDEDASVKSVLTFYKDERFSKVFMVTFWQIIFLFLWSIIPIAGIYFAFTKSYAYSQAQFLALEDSSKEAKSYLKASAKLIDGHKLDRFVLDLSFIGWYILSVFTFGLLSFWVTPYHSLAQSEFYLALKDAKIRE